LERSFTGKNPPDDISVKAKFSESKDLIDRKFKIIKIKKVKKEYKRKILVACFKSIELSIEK